MFAHIISVTLLIVLSAFFSASETALTSSSVSTITEKSKKGNKRAKIFLLLLNDKSALLVLLLMANTFINIFFTTLSTTLAIKYIGTNYIFVIGLVNAVIILLLGEIVPKTYAFNKPVSLALLVSPIIYILVKTLYPIIKIFLVINDLFFKLISNTKIPSNSSDNLENLRGAIELFNCNSSDNNINEKEMLHSLLDLRDLAIGEIMVHRKNVFCVDIDTPKNEIIEEIITSNYTKIPVYKASKDNIIGIIHTKELMKTYLKNKDNFDIQDLIKTPKYFPETSDAFDLLISMQSSKDKLVIVVDEYGGFMGIISVSDILEEIVGDLKFNSTNNIQKSKDSYIVNGDITIRDLNRKLKWNLPDENATTIAGLILYETGKIPDTGNIFALHNNKFEILEKKKQQIKKIKITPIKTK